MQKTKNSCGTTSWNFAYHYNKCSTLPTGNLRQSAIPNCARGHLTFWSRLPHPEAHTLFTTPPSRLGEKSGQRKNKKQKTDDQEEQADASEQQDEHSQKLKTCFDEASASLASLFDDLFSAKKVLLAGNDTFASVLDVAVKKVEERDDSNDGEDKDSDDASKLACAWEEFKSVEVA